MRRRRPPAPSGRLPPPPGGQDPPPLDRRNDGGRRGNGSGEYGDRDDVDACDQYRRVVHWAGGLGGVVYAVELICSGSNSGQMI